MNSQTLKVRFVGGSEHNKILEVNASPVIKLFTPSGVNIHGTTNYSRKTNDYHLFQMCSSWNTVYYEYIHESLCEGMTVKSEVFVEPKFPKLRNLFLVCDLKGIHLRRREQK